MYYLSLAIVGTFLLIIADVFFLEQVREDMEADLGFRSE